MLYREALETLPLKSKTEMPDAVCIISITLTVRSSDVRQAKKLEARELERREGNSYPQVIWSFT